MKNGEKITLLGQTALEVFRRFLKFLGHFLKLCWAFILRHRRGFSLSAAVLTVIFALFLIFYYLTTDVFYYHSKLNNLVVSERRAVHPVKPESKEQAYVRMYFSGGQSYHMRLPYNGRHNILGVYQDDKSGTLIVDWAPGFAQSWQEGVLEEDTKLFFLSVQKNFRIKNIRFLVDGRPAGLQWNGVSLDEGLPLDKMKIGENK